LAEVTNTDWDAGRGELNAALGSIREQVEPDLADPKDSYLLSELIHRRARAYRVADIGLLTPTALAKHWKRVEVEAKNTTTKVPATNQAATTNQLCQTCGGDRFVPYSTRKEGTDEVEEMAPCPDCNPIEVWTRRDDGTAARTPDPDRVRERLTR